jgi:hypothetical protein
VNQLIDDLALSATMQLTCLDFLLINSFRLGIRFQSKHARNQDLVKIGQIDARGQKIYRLAE